MDIKIFDGDYAFLSNFYEVPVIYKYVYGSAEAAYQAQKAIDSNDAFEFTKYNPKQAKSMGHKIEIRDDWEDVKVAFMRDILFAKFIQNPKLTKRLLETGDNKLIYDNNLHDTFWGVDSETGAGQNNLGKILMELRTELLQPEIELLNYKKNSLTRFAAPELPVCDWVPPETTFQWEQPNQKKIHLEFETIYKIEPKETDEDFEDPPGLEYCIWHFRGRLFADLDFLLGEEVKTLYKDDYTIQKIKTYDDGQKFFYQANRIPTFDEFDVEWDNVNEFVIFRDEKGVHLFRSQHGWKIPRIIIYTGLKNSVPALEKILAQLD